MRPHLSFTTVAGANYQGSSMFTSVCGNMMNIQILMPSCFRCICPISFTITAQEGIFINLKKVIAGSGLSLANCHGEFGV